MVFAVICSKRFGTLEIAPHRLQFIDQVPSAFARANRREWLTHLKLSGRN
jgi:hypothetical protein